MNKSQILYFQSFIKLNHTNLQEWKSTSNVTKNAEIKASLVKSVCKVMSCLEGDSALTKILCLSLLARPSICGHIDFLTC